MSADVDNLTENERKRLELLTTIQEMLAADYKSADIASALGISTRTVFRYKDCNPYEQCRLERPSRHREIFKYKDEIISLLKDGYHVAGVAQELKANGCPLGGSTLRRYTKKLATECGIDINKTRKGPNIESKKSFDRNTSNTVVLKKQDLIKLLWMNTPEGFANISFSNLYRQYPVVQKLKVCIEEFRQIFIRRSMPCLYLFIERYKNDELAPIASFAKGLERDLDAVENAVASPLSNGFVEGINNRTKMIKRVMYGRCGLELLSAKIMLPYI
jgi:hypothetical protein